MFISVTWWRRRCSGKRRRFGWRCCRFWWWCAGSFAPPVYLRILCCGIVAWKAAIHTIVETIAGCLSIAAFTFFCPGNSTPHFFTSWTSVQGFVNNCCVSPIAARKNPLLVILAISKLRRMSDCSSCTRPPCLTIVAEMLKTYNKLVAASKRKI